MLRIQKFIFNPFEENTYVIYDDTSLHAWIIDPGAYEKSEFFELTDFIQKNNLTPKAVINTHCHIDHVLGNYSITSAYNIPLIIGEHELQTLNSVQVYAPVYGFNAYQPMQPEVLLKHQQLIQLHEKKFEIRHVPGHSAGHIALIQHEMKWCISGDVLFDRSIGRTDLPGGDYQLLIKSIHTQLLSLDDDYIVYCGHGNETTIGKERKFNPFLNH